VTRGRGAGGLAVLLAAVLALLAVPAGPAAAGTGAGPDVPSPPAGAPWFGPSLDWAGDSAAAYTERLGTAPALFAHTMPYPLGPDDVTYVEQYVDQVARLGAVAFLSLEPRTALPDLTRNEAEELAALLAELGQQRGTRFLVRFAPEMNGSWRTWGQQPGDYVQAFRTVADAVHAGAPNAAMLWSPAYGAGYPFADAVGLVPGSGARDLAELDTTGDGSVGPDDDPYAPYWPGGEYVDWVGLSLLHFGPAASLGSDAVPEPGTFVGELTGTAGYGERPGEGRDFLASYVQAAGKPMAVETSALFAPGTAATGAQELAVKQAWWRQVFAAVTTVPGVQAVVWPELERPEAEAAGAVVDWRATSTPELAGALRADLAAAGLTTGAVTRATDPEAGAALAQVRERTPTGAGPQMGWIVFCAVVLVLVLLVSGLVGRFVPGWRYPDEHDPRDRRLDLFRGWIIVAVVVTHVEVSGVWSDVTLNAIGAITGAELFVLLSGLVLGMVYPIAVRRLGGPAAALGMLERARRLYLTALAVVLLVYLLSLLPFVDGAVVTTFTDRGTGAAGADAAGRVYDLYANAGKLFTYPPPWYAVQDLLLLQMGPWVFNIMGLFVLLTLLVPGLVWLLRRRLWWLVLGVSWALYALETRYSLRVLPSQFEDSFPLLTWQIAFTHGLVLGFHRRQVTRALTGRVGRVAVGALAGLYAGALALLWAGHRWGVGLPFVPAGTYDGLYGTLYQRTDLQLGRLVDLALMIVVAYAFLTAFWKPVDRAVGWFYVPLGSSSLYVFIVHVLFVLAVGNIPGLDRSDWWVGTGVHTAVLAVIWLMVRRRFLFRVVPT
jgi:hypothetical protein